MAAKLNVDEARNGEENTTVVDETHLQTNGEENTTQSQLVTPSSCTPDKTAAPDNFIMVVVVPLSASNSESKPCDGGDAETQTTTTQSLENKPDKCNTSTLRCGEKRQRESEDPSNAPVKRRPSEQSKKESLPDYDARCAELWVHGEMAACEAYELSKSRSNTQHQRAVRQQDSRPLSNSEIFRLIRIEMAACYQPITKMLRLSMERSRAEFNEMISRLNAIQRDTRELFNEVRSMRTDGRLALDAISLMNERMSVIQRFAVDLHQAMTTRK